MPTPSNTQFSPVRSGGAYSKAPQPGMLKRPSPFGASMGAGQTAAPRSSMQPMTEPRSAQLGGAPMGGGGAGMAGRVAGMFGGGMQMPKMPQQMGMGGALMSDERSKQKIEELEGIKQRYLALIDGGEADGGFESVGAHEFEYKPEFQDKPGAGRGRFAGPMTSELKGIPGVVKEGPGGMEQVDAPRLTMANASQIGNLTREKADRAEIDDLRARLAALSDDPDATLDVAGGRRR